MLSPECVLCTGFGCIGRGNPGEGTNQFCIPWCRQCPIFFLAFFFFSFSFFKIFFLNFFFASSGFWGSGRVGGTQVRWCTWIMMVVWSYHAYLSRKGKGGGKGRNTAATPGTEDIRSTNISRSAGFSLLNQLDISTFRHTPTSRLPSTLETTRASLKTYFNPTKAATLSKISVIIQLTHPLTHPLTYLDTRLEHFNSHCFKHQHPRALHWQLQTVSMAILHYLSRPHILIGFPPLQSTHSRIAALQKCLPQPWNTLSKIQLPLYLWVTTSMGQLQRLFLHALAHHPIGHCHLLLQSRPWCSRYLDNGF